MHIKKKLLFSAILSTAMATPAFADGQITIIQTGDFHGHLNPRPNLRSNADHPGQMVGGLARIAAEIKNIQKGKGGVGNTLVLHTGDTIQGSGEALYTRGQAIVDVVDMLGIDHYAPGNWDYVYGTDRFVELFATPLKNGKDKSNTRWGGLASNLYYTSTASGAPLDPSSASSDQGANLTQVENDNYVDWYMQNGTRVLKPYAVHTINGMKVGVLGCTTSRGPQVVGKWVTAGLEFTDCKKEAKAFTKLLRTVEKVDVVIMITEIEIGRNIELIKTLGDDEHIDIVLNADMHEESIDPIKVTDAKGQTTWILETGQDGTLINEVTLSVKAGVMTGMEHHAHRIDDRIVEDKKVAEKVEDVREPFNEDFDASIPCGVGSPYLNPFTQSTCLKGPLSQAIGTTQVALQRNNYSDEDMPAVIEGSSHDFIADAIRWWAKSDLATVRGFRYGTHVAPHGPITRNDLYHYIPIGARVGKVSRITLNQLRNQLDNSSLAVFSSTPGAVVTPRPAYNNPAFAVYGTGNGTSPGAGLPGGGLAGNSLGFGGGWLFAYSGDGFHMDFDPYFTPNWQTVYNGKVPAPVAPATTPASGIYLTDNTQITNPKGDTSRARNFTVKMPCKYLPPAEQVLHGGCTNPDEKFATMLTNGTDGKYMPNWTANYATAKDTYLLNPNGWQFLKGTPNNPLGALAVKAPFQAPLFTAAGYFYAQSPNTVNNCNNCFPTGPSQAPSALLDPSDSASIGLNPDAAYLLPVNVNPVTGEAMLDKNLNPVVMKDASKADGLARDESNHPVVDGNPIDLTEIVEKYVASLGGVVTEDNLPKHRIGLVNPLPTSSAGLRIMQPLCGTIGQPVGGNACP